jgi:hypothetical protein
MLYAPLNLGVGWRLVVSFTLRPYTPTPLDADAYKKYQPLSEIETRLYDHLADRSSPALIFNKLLYKGKGVPLHAIEAYGGRGGIAPIRN